MYLVLKNVKKAPYMVRIQYKTLYFIQTKNFHKQRIKYMLQRNNKL